MILITGQYHTLNSLYRKAAHTTLLLLLKQYFGFAAAKHVAFAKPELIVSSSSSSSSSLQGIVKAGFASAPDYFARLFALIPKAHDKNAWPALYLTIFLFIANSRIIKDIRNGSFKIFYTLTIFGSDRF